MQASLMQSSCTRKAFSEVRMMMILALETTAACNLRCVYCRADAVESPAARELSTGEVLALIEEVAPLRPLLILSGGEPLLRLDIFEIAASASSCGIRVALATNGTLLTPEVVDSIIESGISRVSVSLDGATARKNDATRGAGSFDMAVRGIGHLRGRVDFQINMTLTKRNYDQVGPMLDLAEKLGAIAVHFFFMVPTGRGREDDLLDPDREEALLFEIARERRPIEIQTTCAPQYARVVQQARELDEAPPEHVQENGSMAPFAVPPSQSSGLSSTSGQFRRRTGGCMAGKSFIFVSRTGEVYPCGYFKESAGNIRDRGFMRIWETSDLLRDLRDARLGGKCGSCSYAKLCGGCRARAYAMTGDYLQADPACSWEG